MDDGAIGPQDAYLPIEAYGLIGDCGSAALVSAHASIDWLCLPRFDSEPLFGRLLDPGAGSFAVAPTESFTATHRYVPRTAVLATTFVTATGRATVYDFFAAREGPAKHRGLWPFRYLVRRVEGEEGRVRFVAKVCTGGTFGRRRMRRFRGGHGLAFQRGGGVLYCQASPAWDLADDAAYATFEVAEGERQYFALAYAGRDLGVLPPIGTFAEDAFHETVAYWRAWSDRSSASSCISEAVLRSALTIKLLTYAPSGAVVAAPTTSLPEDVGGVRNWDYRYAWLRDASWSVASLFDLGYGEEARAFFYWATNAARLSLPKVRTVYGLYGASRLREREIAGLRGYRDSRPVRIGNAAADQLQLDNWGHLVNAAFEYAKRTGELDDGLWSSMRALVDFVAGNWERPDRGIWEVRGDPKHFVHSKVMCWAALDRGARLARDLDLAAPVERWTEAADEVKAAVLSRGVDDRRGHLVRAFGDSDVDAALLLVPIVGFLPGEDPLIGRTIERVREQLGDGDLVRRYLTEDGLPGRDGAFLPCSFWLAQALALAGEYDEACKVFDAACARANQLGLLPEEIDPDTGGFLGNFPQGLSHIALIHAALTLSRTSVGSEA